MSRVVRRIFDVRGRKGQRDTENSVVSFCSSSPNINAFGGRRIVHMWHVACLW